MRFLLLLISLFLVTACTPDRDSADHEVTSDLPNIVWFVSEDNSQFLGAYGNEFVRTPTLDSLAAMGVLYRNAYSNAPVCAPSRSGIITGVYPVSMGTQEMRSYVAIPDEINYYIDYLKDRDYYLTLRRKRDYNISGRENDAWDQDDMWNFNEAFRERKEGQPFYMFYNTFQTHESRQHSPEAGREYFNSTFNYLGEEVTDSLWNTIIPTDPDIIDVPDYLPDLPEVRSDLANYYTMMQAMDLEFKMFLKELENSGELENTIIIYTSDHGGVMARSKRFAMETGLKIPLFIWFPEKYRHLSPAAPGSELNDLVSLIDIPPTILDMAGIVSPDYFDGSSLLERDTSDSDVVFGFRGRMDEKIDMVRTIRQGKYRYTQVFYPHRPDGQFIQYLWRAPHLAAWEKYHKEGNTNDTTARFFEMREAEGLYDVENDPWQLNNLAADPAFSGLLDSLREQQSDYLKEIGDLGFIPEGILFERFREDSTLYSRQYDEETLSDIIDNGIRATVSPDRNSLTALVERPDPAYRFWAAMGAINLVRDGQDVSGLLEELATDESGDVRATAAEGLYYAGRGEEARSLLFSLLENDNPYVLVRVLGTIDYLGLDTSSVKDQLESLKEPDWGMHVDGYIDWLVDTLIAGQQENGG